MKVVPGEKIRSFREAALFAFEESGDAGIEPGLVRLCCGYLLVDLDAQPYSMLGLAPDRTMIVQLRLEG